MTLVMNQGAYMRSILILLLLLSNTTYGQKPKPGEVDTLEVKRWGNRVTEVGTGIRAADEALTSMAMQVPVDDSDMWNITVWGNSRDQATVNLVKAFEKDDNLSCFIGEPPAVDGKKQKPWAHFNVYYADNGMQKFRFDRYKIPIQGPFPIITLNAPRNGHFGDFNVVIDRIEATAIKSPKDLNRRLVTVVDLWCKKLASEGFIPPKQSVDQFYGSTTVAADTTPRGGHEQSGQYGFPWGPDVPPKQQPVNPTYPVNGPPTTDPTQPTEGGFFLTLLDDHPSLVLMLIGALQVIQMVFPGPVAAFAKFIESMLSRKKTVIPEGFVVMQVNGVPTLVKKDASSKG